MSDVVIREMEREDEYFVGTCSHRHESPEIDACAERRVEWLRAHHDVGVRALVALLDDRKAGFLYGMPIERSPWGPAGRGLFALPCLFVPERLAGHGVGGALLAAAEAEARRQGHGGVTLYAHERAGWWFMPAGWFRQRGYEEVARRGIERLLWKRWEDGAETPRFLEARYVFRPASGRVVVDLFWNRFCLTSEVEAERVREVAAEFGERVVLNEYSACDAAVLCEHGIPRAIYVQGAEIAWGYEAPRDGIRDAIRAALSVLGA